MTTAIVSKLKCSFVKHLRYGVLRKQLAALSRCFCKTLHLRCLRGFWICLCTCLLTYSPIYLPYTLSPPKMIRERDIRNWNLQERCFFFLRFSCALKANCKRKAANAKQALANSSECISSEKDLHREWFSLDFTVIFDVSIINRVN